MPISSYGSGRLALLVAAVLAVLVVWQGVRLAWLVVDGPQVAPAPMPGVPTAAPLAGDRNGEFRWELFGSATDRTIIQQAAPVSRSALRLRGVVASPAGGYAIIAGADSADEVYRVGDELPDGARVESIEARRVVLVRNGRAEALEMDQATTRSGPASGSRAVPESTGQRSVELPGIRGFTAGEGASIASLPDLAAGARIDVAELAGAISVMPVSGGGFRVRPGRDATLFSRLGLQVNDVVTAVNGQPLESEEAVRALFSDVLERGEVSITVNRQGREITLRPDLEEILGSL